MTDQQRSTLRKVLMIGGPLIVLLIVGVIWLTSGRYISTDNAYVKADMVMMSPQISGAVISKLVDNNQAVKTGDKIVTIDPLPFQVALNKAQANLTIVKTTVEKTKAQYAQMQEQIVSAQAEADFADVQFERAKKLSSTDAVSKSNLDSATRDRDTARAQVALLQRESEGVLAQLEGNPDIKPEDSAMYKQAQEMVNAAQLDLDHTIITASADGIVGSVPNVGDYARAGIPMMSLVQTDRVWVEANYKETEIEKIRPGQAAEIKVDTYPNKSWKGSVESISPATGSEFSVLPAQNATGNWVKVVQRITVRIKVDDADALKYLRAGMSADIKVDTQSER